MFHRLLDFIIYGNVFIAFCAAFSTLATVKLLNINPSNDAKGIELAIFVGSATFFLYNLHKPVTYFLRAPFINNQRFIRTKAFEGPLSILSILAFIVCIYYFFQLNIAAQILLICMGILSFAYVLPVFGKGLRLRDVAFLKIFLIAVVWSAVVVGLPFLTLNKGEISSEFWLLCVERSSFIFALCIPFDIRDMDWDSQTKVKTIPLSIGVKKAKIISLGALTITILMDFLLLNKAIYNEMLCFRLIIVYLITAFVVLKTDKNKSDYYFYGGVDGMILLHSWAFFIT